MESGVVESFSTVPPWLQVVGILSLSFVVAKIIEVVGRYLLRRSPTDGKSRHDQILIEETYVPLYVTVFLIGVYISSQLLEQGTVGIYVANVAVSIILIVWAYAVSRIGSRIITVRTDTPSGREIAPIIRNILTFFIVLGAFFILLSVWEIDITPLIASAGVIGIVLGIAARDSIGNFFGGISLYLDKTYKVGDMLQLESGQRGTVLDMSIRSTTILTRDNVAVTIPNAEMNSTQVINESAPNRRRRIRLDVGVAYGSDLETVKETLLSVAAEERLILDSPSPAVRFREFGDSAITAQLQCHIENPGLRARARHRLIEGIDRQFREKEIKIPFPQRELTFFEADNEISISSKSVADRPTATVVDEPGESNTIDERTESNLVDERPESNGAGERAERPPDRDTEKRGDADR